MGDKEKAEVEAAPETPAEPKKKSSLMLILIVLVIGAAMGAGGWYLGKTMTGGGADDGASDTEKQVKADAAGGASHGAPAHGEKKKSGGHGDGSDKEATPQEARDAVSVTLGPIMTNLQDENIRRSVSVTLVIKAVDADGKGVIERSSYELQSQCLLILSSKTRESLESLEGKELLLEQFKHRFEQIVGKHVIHSVLYQQFGLI